MLSGRCRIPLVPDLPPEDVKRVPSCSLYFSFGMLFCAVPRLHKVPLHKTGLRIPLPQKVMFHHVSRDFIHQRFLSFGRRVRISKDAEKPLLFITQKCLIYIRNLCGAVHRILKSEIEALVLFPDAIQKENGTEPECDVPGSVPSFYSSSFQICRLPRNSRQTPSPISQRRAKRNAAPLPFPDPKHRTRIWLAA